MSRIFAAAWVIARRDFIATVWSRFFLLFLLAPVVAFGFAFAFGEVTGKADIEASRPIVAVATDVESGQALQAAHQRVTAAIGEIRLPAFELVDPAADRTAQVNYLLGNKDRDISAVLTGSLTRPVLNGPPRSLENLSDVVTLVVEDANRVDALRGAGVAERKVVIAKVATGQSAGSLSMVRHVLARAGQILIFVLTLMLATMLLSNLVEEKSNKVIEVLAAAVPLDAVFLGKLIAMLGVSMVGILIWGSLAGLGLVLVLDLIQTPLMPGVGWPAYIVLLLLYFAVNYMLLGAVFLGVGGQASNVREVQTLSMPITLVQVVIFALASAAVGDRYGTMTWVGAIFPLSSPLTMIALAAESGTLWIHLLALIWQAAWIVLIIRISSRMFRATVLKTGTRTPFFEFRRKKSFPVFAGEDVLNPAPAPPAPKARS